MSNYTKSNPPCNPLCNSSISLKYSNNPLMVVCFYKPTLTLPEFWAQKTKGSALTLAFCISPHDVTCLRLRSGRYVPHPQLASASWLLSPGWALKGFAAVNAPVSFPDESDSQTFPTADILICSSSERTGGTNYTYHFPPVIAVICPN